MSDVSLEPEQLPAADPAVVIQQLNEWADGVIGSKRSKKRFPIFCSLLLTPLDTAGSDLGQSVQVIGKDLSTQGIAFSHMEPLGCKRAVVTYSHPNAGRFSVELQVLWTKPTPIGHYESGCRLIRKMPDCHVLLVGCSSA